MHGGMRPISSVVKFSDKRNGTRATHKPLTKLEDIWSHCPNNLAEDVSNVRQFNPLLAMTSYIYTPNSVLLKFLHIVAYEWQNNYISNTLVIYELLYVGLDAPTNFSSQRDGWQDKYCADMGWFRVAERRCATVRS